jgi:hypothetical protein
MMKMHSLIDMNRGRLVRAALALGACLGAAAASADPDPFAGVSVGASASHVTIVCSTCPTPRTTDDDTQRGGPGTTAALYANSDVGFSVGANAAFDAAGLPSLGVFTFAEVVPLTLGADLYDAFATAKGLQRFDYLGTAPTTYTISFAIEGSFTLGTADSGSPMEIFGGFTVFGSDFHPVGESHGTVLGSDFVSEHAENGGVSQFSLPGEFSFTVNPGDSFYVQAQMTALSITNIAHQASGTVDALHTLAGTFTAGDIGLLAAAIGPVAVSPVPEAPTLPIFTAGLLAMAWRLRRRQR